MLIYGFDMATKTGVAIWDTDRPASSMRCFTLKTYGEFAGAKAFNVGVMVKNLIIREGDPDYAIFEKPLDMIPAGKSAAGLLLPTRIAGAVQGVVGCWGCAMEEVPSQTWRKGVYGFGTKKGWKPEDWKNHAKTSCEKANIVVKNYDEAEAAMIAFWCGRKSQQFKMAQG